MAHIPPTPDLNIVSFYLPPPRIFVKSGNMKLIPRSTALMSFLTQKYARHLHSILYLCIRTTIYMPKKTPTTADFNRLSSPTSEIVNDNIQHPPGKRQLDPPPHPELKMVSIPPFPKKTIAVHVGAQIFAGTALTRIFFLNMKG